MRKGGGEREEKEEGEKREKEEEKRIRRRWRGGKRNNEKGGGWRSAASSRRRRCAVPLLPGSVRLGSALPCPAWFGSRLPGGGWHGSLLARGRLWGCPDFLPAAEGIGAVPFLFQLREDLGRSRSPSHSRRGRGCPPLLLAATLSCAGSRAPTFWGGGAG